MVSLPYFQSDSKDLSLLQTGWSQLLNPLIANPISNGIFLKGKLLINGVTVINHLLGRKQQGWIITDRNASGTIYRSAPLNAQTLTLTSDNQLVVDLYVF